MKSKNNQIIVAGAHNPLAAIEIEKYLASLNSKKKIIMLLGMMANKDHEQFIKIFKKRINSIVTLDIPNQKKFINTSPNSTQFHQNSILNSKLYDKIHNHLLNFIKPCSCSLKNHQKS